MGNGIHTDRRKVEAKNKGSYHHSVQTRISASYTHHYRQILPPLLEVLTFRSNNEQYRPLLEALAVVAAYLEDKDPFYPVDQEVTIENVIQKQWQNWNSAKRTKLRVESG